MLVAVNTVDMYTLNSVTTINLLKHSPSLKTAITQECPFDCHSNHVKDRIFLASTDSALKIQGAETISFFKVRKATVAKNSNQSPSQITNQPSYIPLLSKYSFLNSELNDQPVSPGSILDMEFLYLSWYVTVSFVLYGFLAL